MWSSRLATLADSSSACYLWTGLNRRRDWRLLRRRLHLLLLAVRVLVVRARAAVQRTAERGQLG